MEIWRLKDNGVTNLTFGGHVTIRLPGVDFLSVVHSDHASILHRYGDMAPQILDARTWTQKERRKNEKRKRRGKEGKRKVKKKKEGKGEGKNGK